MRRVARWARGTSAAALITPVAASARRTRLKAGLPVLVATWGLAGVALLTAASAAGAAQPRVRVAATPATVEPAATLRVSGSVAGRIPGARSSYRVYLEERVGRRWTRRASASLTPGLSFVARWRAPVALGTRTLRVRLVRKRDVIATSRLWRVQVAPTRTEPGNTSPLAAPPPSAPLPPIERPPPSAPAAPDGLGAAPGDEAVRVTWTSSAAAGRTLVLRANGASGPFSEIADLPVTARSYVDETVSNGSSYVYRLVNVAEGLASTGRFDSRDAHRPMRAAALQHALAQRHGPRRLPCHRA